MKIHLHTLGCRLNEAELETWAEHFQAQGHHIVQTPEQADLLVINTCAVTQEAVKKSRQIIRRAHKRNPKAKLIVSGCYATLDSNIKLDIDSIDLIVGNKQKDDLVNIVLDELNIDAMPTLASEPGEAAIFQRGRNRAFIKVQDGCRYRCTFCIVTIARGEEKSRKISAIIEEINSIHAKGIQEIVLTGVHLGGYGSNIDTNLTQLINTILSETTVPRIRLGSLEPWELDDKFFSLFSNPRLMPHLHLPLQSGVDSVLRRMARRCKTNDFAGLINKARELIPDINITTDIIVGFPGESDKEWQASLAFIKKMAFSHIHIFTYSPRAGTKAATLPEPVANDLKKQRSHALHILTQTMRINFLNKHVNTQREVLWETKNGDGFWTGYTDNYIRVVLKHVCDENLENTITKVKLTSPSINSGIYKASLLN